MRPAGLVIVCNEIVHRGKTRIVECGSGVSTVVLARLLRQGGGGATIVALEHDAQWAALVTDMLARGSLLDVARVVHPPLEGDPPWYAGPHGDARSRRSSRGRRTSGPRPWTRPSPRASPCGFRTAPDRDGNRHPRRRESTRRTRRAQLLGIRDVMAFLGRPSRRRGNRPAQPRYLTTCSSTVDAGFTGPSGELVHAEVRIGDSVIMLTDETDDGAPAKSPQSLGHVVTAIMATYWDDVDAAWQRALTAGAGVVYPLVDQFYGERAGRLRDPFGQQWMLSQRIESMSAEEMARRAAAFFDQSD